MTNSKGIIQTVNPAFTEITGYTAEQSIGQKPSFLKSGKHDSTFYETMWKQLGEQQSWSGNIWNKKKDGSLCLQYLTIDGIQNDVGEIAYYVGVINEIDPAEIQGVSLKGNLNKK